MLDVDAEVAALNDRGYNVNFIQGDRLTKGWGAAIFCVRRSPTGGRWYAQGEGRTLPDALAAALLDLTAPPRIFSRPPSTPNARMEDLL